MHPDMNSIKRSDWIEQLQVYNCGLMKEVSQQWGGAHHLKSEKNDI